MTRTLHRGQILRGYRSFTAVISQGRSFTSRPVRLFVLVDSGGTPGMLMGFTSARGIRGAVRRNRVKRLLREAFRLQQEAVERTITDRGLSLQCVLMYVGPRPDAPRMLRLPDVLDPVRLLLERIPASFLGPL